MTTYSSPGKVLVVGGYTVLFPENFGLSITVSSRFYSTVYKTAHNNKVNGLRVTVKIAQFSDQDLEYLITKEETKPINSKEVFVKNILDTVFAYIKLANSDLVKNEHLVVLLNADNEFYSIPHSRKEDLDEFNSIKCNKYKNCFIKDVSKTGLGSSAALCVSLIGVLLDYFFKGFNNKEVLYKLSFISNSINQGKIGSGFDVSSGIYGTQIYSTIKDEQIKSMILDMKNHDCLKTLLEIGWDNRIIEFRLPENWDIVVGDVSAGTNTPSMVKKFMQWRANNKDHELWARLVELNNKAKNSFLQLSSESNPVSINQNTPNQLKNVNKEIRKLIQELSRLINIPIEPKEQSVLLDKLSEKEGVVYCGVPGAGGYDAIFCIFDKSYEQDIIRELEGYNELKIKVLKSRYETPTLGIKAESKGLTEYFINKEKN